MQQAGCFATGARVGADFPQVECGHRPTGRASRGDRVVVYSRMPRPQADAVKGWPTTRGMHVSDLVAGLVALGLRHQAELPAPTQESLAISA